MRRTTRTKTVSLDADVLSKGLQNAQRRGFKNSFSAYIAKRILEDDEDLRRHDKSEQKAAR